MIKDTMMFALLNFKARKLRTFLTILGIMVGIAAVVSLISIGQGLQATIDEQFKSLGTDKIIITPKGSGFIPGLSASAITLDTSDLERIRSVRGVDEAGGMIFRLARIESSGKQKNTFISGIPQDETKKIFSDIETLTVVKGRDLRDTDKDSALIGSLIHEGKFFDHKVNIRDTLVIDERPIKVVGVLGRIGNPEDDSQIILPLDTVRDMFDEPMRVDHIMARTTNGFSPSAVSESINRELRRHRNLEKGKEDFDVQTFEQILTTFNNIFAIVQAILIGIAAISIVVGGIGIMNTMYTAVLQRTQEIGLMKSVGAKNSDIITLFIIESGFLGLVGGIIGGFLGLSIGWLVQAGAEFFGIVFTVHIDAVLISGSLFFSFLSGVIAGLAPALRASKLKPVDALRYE